MLVRGVSTSPSSTLSVSRATYSGTGSSETATQSVTGDVNGGSYTLTFQAVDSNGNPISTLSGTYSAQVSFAMGGENGYPNATNGDMVSGSSLDMSTANDKNGQSDFTNATISFGANGTFTLTYDINPTVTPASINPDKLTIATTNGITTTIWLD